MRIEGATCSEEEEKMIYSLKLGYRERLLKTCNGIHRMVSGMLRTACSERGECVVR